MPSNPFTRATMNEKSSCVARLGTWIYRLVIVDCLLKVGTGDVHGKSASLQTGRSRPLLGRTEWPLTEFHPSSSLGERVNRFRVVFLPIGRVWSFSNVEKPEAGKHRARTSGDGRRRAGKSLRCGLTSRDSAPLVLPIQACSVAS